jgi:hypothetical protein
MTESHKRDRRLRLGIWLWGGATAVALALIIVFLCFAIGHMDDKGQMIPGRFAALYRVLKGFAT